LVYGFKKNLQLLLDKRQSRFSLKHGQTFGGLQNAVSGAERVVNIYICAKHVSDGSTGFRFIESGISIKQDPINEADEGEDTATPTRTWCGRGHSTR
jgi:hypothetical protein